MHFHKVLTDKPLYEGLNKPNCLRLINNINQECANDRNNHHCAAGHAITLIHSSHVHNC